MAQVMIVDDAALTRDTLARLLSYEGFTTATAANGRDAYSMLYQGKPQLIILDLMMPQMDGVTFLRLLRSNPHWEDIPVLVMTGYSDQERLVSRARAMGVIDVICKGAADVEQLLATVHRTVQRETRQPKHQPKPQKAAPRGLAMAGV